MSEATEVPAEKLAKIYIKIRDKRTALKAKFTEEDAALVNQLDVLTKEMLELCKGNGADSIRTPAGTIIRGVSTRYWTNDWDSMFKFIKENDAMGLMAQSLNQANMKQFLEENPDVFPPGMMSDSAYKITVRRSR